MGIELKHSRLSKESVSFLKMWSDIARTDIGRRHHMRLYLQKSTKLDKSDLELE